MRSPALNIFVWFLINVCSVQTERKVVSKLLFDMFLCHKKQKVLVNREGQCTLCTVFI